MSKVCFIFDNKKSPAEAGLFIRKRGLLTPVPVSPQIKKVTSHTDRNQNPKSVGEMVGPEIFY
jgi:hypothetical protein